MLIFKMGQGAFHFLFAYQGSQYSLYDYIQPITLQITQDTPPIIVDTLLTLIVMIRQGGYRNLFCL